MNNLVYLIGRLAKIEPHENYGSFVLAVKQDIKNSEGEYGTDFITCKCFSWSLEYMSKYCGVGDLIVVRGRLNESTYEGKTKEVVMVEKMNILAKKQTTSKPVNEFPNTTSIKQEEIVISDDELPF